MSADDLVRMSLAELVEAYAARRLSPVEVMEAEHPVRVEEYAFVPDSCGAGKWRGGVGIKRSYRVLADDALLQLREHDPSR